jgi:PD-(D/E)XK nuclease superfamily
MPWTFQIRPRELRKFRRCRREWDLGSQVRQRYAQKLPSLDSAYDKAIRDALAVYYFPAMDDWNRAIVRPLTIKGFDRSLNEAKVSHEKWAPLTAEEAQEFEADLALGHAMLNNYFVWAAALDDFDSIFADHDIWAPIPDPAEPMHDLGTLNGRPMRYMGRMDQLIADPDDELWIVDHRVVRGDWTSSEDLIEDEVMRSHCWHTQIAFPQMLIAGTITNELRVDGQLDAPPVYEIVERDPRTMIGSRHVQTRRSPLAMEPSSTPASRSAATTEDYVALQQDNGLFRRTVIRRNQETMKKTGVRVADDAIQIRDPEIPVPPTFSDFCAQCEFKAVCDAMEAGEDWQTILDAHFFQRDADAEDESLRHSDHRVGSRAAYGREFRVINMGHR